jgi:hypothetical protein
MTSSVNCELCNLRSRVFFKIEFIFKIFFFGKVRNLRSKAFETPIVVEFLLRNLVRNLVRKLRSSSHLL